MLISVGPRGPAHTVHCTVLHCTVLDCTLTSSHPPIDAPELAEVLDNGPLGQAVLGLLADELGAVTPSEVESLAVHDTVLDPSLAIKRCS